VDVPQNVTWDFAYHEFVKKYGNSGKVRIYNGLNIYPVDWMNICIGFATVPPAGIYVAKPAPSTTCGAVPPPGLTCEVQLPAIVELSSVGLGEGIAVGQGNISVRCSKKATVVASVGRKDPKIAGVSLVTTVNGKLVTSTPSVIGVGENVYATLQFTAAGKFSTAGEYSESIPLIIGYY
jgi:hypothetical protein